MLDEDNRSCGCYLNSRNNSLWPTASNLGPMTFNKQKNINLLSPSNNFYDNNSNFPFFANSNFLPIRNTVPANNISGFPMNNIEDSRISHYGFPFEDTQGFFMPSRNNYLLSSPQKQ